jgi:predicted GIY-YIG superfamily endonuclease
MQDDISPAVYIFASKRNGVIYMGVASSLRTRVALQKREYAPNNDTTTHVR